MIVLWLIIPSISLIIFLIVASHHFGKEDTQFLIIKNSYYYQLLFFLKGSLIVFAPMYFHFEETLFIFKLLLIDSESFYEILSFIETSRILLYGIILSTLSSIILFTKDFELAVRWYRKAEKKIKDVKSIDFENEAEYQRQLELIRYKRDIAEQN